MEAETVVSEKKGDKFSKEKPKEEPNTIRLAGRDDGYENVLNWSVERVENAAQQLSPKEANEMIGVYVIKNAQNLSLDDLEELLLALKNPSFDDDRLAIVGAAILIFFNLHMEGWDLTQIFSFTDMMESVYRPIDRIDTTRNLAHSNNFTLEMYARSHVKDLSMADITSLAQALHSLPFDSSHDDGAQRTRDRMIKFAMQNGKPE